MAMATTTIQHHRRASGIRKPEDWAAKGQDLRVSEASFPVKPGMALLCSTGGLIRT